VFFAIVLANVATLIITLVATLRRPIPTYFMITAMALVASGLSLAQLIVARGSILATASTILLVATLIWRSILNAIEKGERRIRHKSTGKYK